MPIACSGRFSTTLTFALCLAGDGIDFCSKPTKHHPSTLEQFSVTVKPVTIMEKPEITMEKPETIADKPVITTVQPVTTTGKPVISTGNPVTTEKPETTTETRVITTETRVMTTEKPETTTVTPTSGGNVYRVILYFIFIYSEFQISKWDTFSKSFKKMGLRTFGNTSLYQRCILL